MKKSVSKKVIALITTLVVCGSVGAYAAGGSNGGIAGVLCGNASCGGNTSAANTCTKNTQACGNNVSAALQQACNQAAGASKSACPATSSAVSAAVKSAQSIQAASCKSGSCASNQACKVNSCTNGKCTQSSNCVSASSCKSGSCTSNQACKANSCTNGTTCANGNCTQNSNCANQTVCANGSCSDWLNSVLNCLNCGGKTVTQSNSTASKVTASSAPKATTTTSTGSGYAAYQNEVVRLVNQQRAANGLGALAANSALTKTATLKSQDMAKNNYFSHTSPTYGSPFDMMKQFGISYRTAGENIAMGQTSPAQVMQGWMNSPGHRANILNSSFTKIGVGVAQNTNGQYYWTQQFIG